LTCKLPLKKTQTIHIHNTMQEIKNIQVPGKHLKPILTDVIYMKNHQKKPLVIFCHGYKGYKDWGVFNKMTSTFAEEALFFVKFNFSHNGGTPEQPIDFPDLEAFGQNNYVKELDDLESVLDHVLSNRSFEGEFDPEDITLIGHSRGGGLVSLKAAENKKITRLISWAGVADFGARFPVGEVLEKWKNEGVAFIENARTQQQMPHYIQFYENFKANEERLTIRKAVSKLKIPHLIVHGTKDTSVELKEGEYLHQWNANSELFLIDGADHTFGAKQPWTEKNLPEDFQKVLFKTIDFIKTS
jgi:pimeloyl-ACP methyl ester carboxylesterase